MAEKPNPLEYILPFLGQVSQSILGYREQSQQNNYRKALLDQEAKKMDMAERERLLTEQSNPFLHEMLPSPGDRTDFGQGNAPVDFSQISPELAAASGVRRNAAGAAVLGLPVPQTPVQLMENPDPFSQQFDGMPLGVEDAQQRGLFAQTPGDMQDQLGALLRSQGVPSEVQLNPNVRLNVMDRVADNSLRTQDQQWDRGSFDRMKQELDLRNQYGAEGDERQHNYRMEEIAASREGMGGGGGPAGAGLYENSPTSIIMSRFSDDVSKLTAAFADPMVGGDPASASAMAVAQVGPQYLQEAYQAGEDTFNSVAQSVVNSLAISPKFLQLQATLELGGEGRMSEEDRAFFLQVQTLDQMLGAYGFPRRLLQMQTQTVEPPPGMLPYMGGGGQQAPIQGPQGPPMSPWDIPGQMGRGLSDVFKRGAGNIRQGLLGGN